MRSTIPAVLRTRYIGMPHMLATNNIQLWRHATLLLECKGKRLLVDPMLSPKGAMDPIADSSPRERIPMVDLPIDPVMMDAQLRTLDAILVTHLHRDHWDVAAQILLPRDIPLFCQPPDAENLRNQGFEQVISIAEHLEWKGLTITRTGGQHGMGELADAMGPVSGFVFRIDHQVVYLAGDTIWCPEVAQVLSLHQPDWVILNGGAAQFLTGDAITMSDADIGQVANHAPQAKIIVVHLDTVNHCHQTREKLVEALSGKSWKNRVIIPRDGEVFELSN